MNKLALLTLCLLATACRLDGERTGAPNIPGPSVHPWVDIVVPGPTDGNDPSEESVCVPDPSPEAGPTPAWDDDGGADTGEPAFTIGVTPESLALPQGGSIDLFATVIRAEDFDEPIDVTVDGLPDGVIVSALRLEPSECECVYAITLTAASTAASPHANVARVRGTTPSGTRSAEIAVTVRGTPASIDTSFGGGAGRVLAMFAIQDVVEQPDGKILFTGWDDDSGENLTVCRIDSRGAPDLTYGSSGGCARFSPGGRAFGRMLALMSDGRVLVAGGAGATDRTVVARFTPSGELDVTFGSGGSVAIDLEETEFFSGILLVGGKIVLAGSLQSTGGGPIRGLALRLNEDGGLDASFGSGGTILFGEGILGLVPHGDCGFAATSRIGLHAFDWDGQPDPEFGDGDGLVELTISGPVAHGRDGTFYIGGGEGMAVTQVSSTGTIGWTSGPFEAEGIARGLAALADGTTVLGGAVWSNGEIEFGMGRRLPGGEADIGFGDGGSGADYEQGGAFGMEVLGDGRYALFGASAHGEGIVIRIWD